MYYYYSYRFKYGKYNIVEKDESIVGIYEDEFEKNIDYKEKETELIKKTYMEIEEYLNGNRKKFSVKISPEGTEFQKKVWEELIKIPYGETRTYKDIAKNIENEKAYRAVGNANNKNPILIIIPCHRVIGSSGDMTGYRLGIDMKKDLLEMENKNK